MDCIGNFIIMVAPAIACGDEATDIYYIIQNWNTFANPAFKVCSIIFVVFPFVLILLLQIGRSKPRVNFLVDTFLIWTKIQEWIYCHDFDSTEEMKSIRNAVANNTVNKLYDQSSKKYSSIQMLKYQHIIQLFLEDLPQCICQTVNNNLTSWSTWDRISIILTIAMLLFGTMILLFKIFGFRRRSRTFLETAQIIAYRGKAGNLSMNVINNNH